MSWKRPREGMVALDQQGSKKCKWCSKKPNYNGKDLCARCADVYPKVHELYLVCQQLKRAYEKEVLENERNEQ